jgi:hypothetical protein
VWVLLEGLTNEASNYFHRTLGGPFLRAELLPVRKVWRYVRFVRLNALAKLLCICSRNDGFDLVGDIAICSEELLWLVTR